MRYLYAGQTGWVYTEANQVCKCCFPRSCVGDSVMKCTYWSNIESAGVKW